VGKTHNFEIEDLISHQYKQQTYKMKLSLSTIIFTTLAYKATVTKADLRSDIQQRRLEHQKPRTLRKGKNKQGGHTRTTANGATFSSFSMGNQSNQATGSDDRVAKKIRLGQTKAHGNKNDHFQTHIVGGSQAEVGEYPYFGKYRKLQENDDT